MSALSAKLSEKKFAHKDITICLDGTLSARRDEALGDLVAKQRTLEASREEREQPATDARLASSPIAAFAKAVEVARETIAAIEDEMRASSIIIRLTAVSFGEYNKFVIQNKPRKDSVGDQQFGFNTQTFFMFVARRTGAYIDADGNSNVITEEEWDAIEEALTDGDHDRLAGAVLDLNRRDGQRGVDFLLRASEVTPDSSETSESPETQE